MKIIDIRNLDQLENFEKDWNTLIEKCPGSVHTQTYAWINAFFRYKLLPDQKWICLFAYHDLELAAVYPLVISRSIGLPGLKFQMFTTPHDIYTTIRVDGLILPGYEDILELLVNHLKRSFKAIPVILIRGIPGSSPSMIFFHNKKKRLDFYKKYAGGENFIPLPENHHIYLSSLKPKLKSDIDRQLRRLTSKTNVSFSFGDNQRTNEENLELFKELESSGWKGKRKTAIKTRPGDPELYLSATNKFHEKSWIQWSFLKVNNEIIAAKLFSRINNTTVFWKTAYKENYSRFGPGILLFYKSLENFYSCGKLGEINCMNVNNWFKIWNVSERPLYTIIIFPRIVLLAALIKLLLRIKFG